MTGPPPRLTPPDLDAAAVTAALVGAWRLVELTIHHPDGGRDQPFGPAPVGQLIYSANGHMSFHMTVPARPLLGAALDAVDDAALGRAMRGYSGYWGRFTVDAAAGTVTHQVDGAWFPDFATADQVRRYGFADDRLILEADVGEDLVRLVWERPRT